MPEPLLKVRALDAFYGDFQALFGVAVEVAAGEAVAVIGANGAGKSTLLNSIAGLIRARPQTIVFDGLAIGFASGLYGQTGQALAWTASALIFAFASLLVAGQIMLDNRAPATVHR